MAKLTNLSTNQSVDCPEGSSFREVALEHDLGIPFGCESGICCTCLIQIKSGMENLGPKNEQEEFTLEARGSLPEERLACQCMVQGDVTFEQSF